MSYKLFISIILLVVAVAVGYLFHVVPASTVVEESAEEAVTESEEYAEVVENIPSTKKEAEASIVGYWQSTDDPKSFVQFVENGSVRHVYDGALVGEGTWQVSMVSHERPEVEGELFLQQILDGELMEYGLYEVDDESLVLNYLARGNTLSYKRTEAVVDSDALEDWVLYVNDEYGFDVVHPPSWEVQEALKPRQTRALHEIYIQETEYNMWRADVTVGIFTNEDSMSIMDWWTAWLEEEDQKETACRVEYGDTSPCLYLRGMVEDETVTEFAGREAVRVTLFQFDHTEVCTYVAEGEYVFGLCAAGDNPNDPDADVHQKTTEQIINSFSFK